MWVQTMKFFRKDIFYILCLTIIFLVIFNDVKDRVVRILENYGYVLENPKYNLEHMDFKHIDKSEYVGFQYEL